MQGTEPARPTEITSKTNASDGQTRTARLTPHISLSVLPFSLLGTEQNIPKGRAEQSQRWKQIGILRLR